MGTHKNRREPSRMRVYFTFVSCRAFCRAQHTSEKASERVKERSPERHKMLIKKIFNFLHFMTIVTRSDSRAEPLWLGLRISILRFLADFCNTEILIPSYAVAETIWTLAVVPAMLIIIMKITYVELHKTSCCCWEYFAYHVNRLSVERLRHRSLVYIRKGKIAKNKVNKVMIASTFRIPITSGELTDERARRRRRRAFNIISQSCISSNLDQIISGERRQSSSSRADTNTRKKSELTAVSRPVDCRVATFSRERTPSDDDVRRVRLVSITLCSSIKVGNFWKINDFSLLPPPLSPLHPMNNSMQLRQWYHRSPHNRYCRHHHNHHRRWLGESKSCSTRKEEEEIDI